MNPMWSRRIDGRSASPKVATSCAITRRVPEVGRRMQPRIESSVVLPLPDGPTISANSPLRRSIETSSSAHSAASPWAYVFVRPTPSSTVLIAIHAYPYSPVAHSPLEDARWVEPRHFVDGDERRSAAHQDGHAQHADGDRPRHENGRPAFGAAANDEPTDQHR